MSCLPNLGKEIQLVWNGVAVSSKLLAENPQSGRTIPARAWPRAESLRGVIETRPSRSSASAILLLWTPSRSITK